MTSGLFHALRSPVALACAALMVGVAIVLDGSAARVVNGSGGLLWIASFGAMAWSLRTAVNRWLGAGTVLAAALVLAIFVRPSDGPIAILGFGAAAALVAWLTGERAGEWTILVPAAWLPVHLLVAVAKAAWRAIDGTGQTIRTEPPPTTAAVPLLMVVAAWAVRNAVVSIASQSERTEAAGAEGCLRTVSLRCNVIGW